MKTKTFNVGVLIPPLAHLEYPREGILYQERDVEVDSQRQRFE